MYSRYVRDDRGTYTRITPQETPPPPPPTGQPNGNAPPKQPPPPKGGETRPPESGFLNHLLEQLHLGDLDSGDLLLLGLLFFLFKKKADEELLIALGLLLIL